MERKLIAWLRTEFPLSDSGSLGIGDDCAVLDWPSGKLVVTTDSICDGVHFQSDVHAPELIGHKAVGVNLSDLASMGARPVAVTVSLALPRTAELEWVKRLFLGMRPLLDRNGVVLCGGDTVAWGDALMISVTAIGEAPADGCWLISSAQAGDRILVTGQLGGSLLGRHLAVEPRCDFAMAFRDRGLVHACTDVSDSLGLDAVKLASASGCGLELDTSRIPIAEAARELSRQTGNRTPLQHALEDGEDFELIVTAAPEHAAVIIDEWKGVPLTDIGTVNDQPGQYWLVDGEGHRERLEPRGYEHEFEKAE